MGIVNRINARFRHGEPSNDLDTAGVLVHSADGLWNPGDERGDGKHAAEQKDLQIWLPCKDKDWCSGYADRLSASIINHRLPYPFSYRNPSFIVRPSVGSKAISCMFAGDGSTMARACVPPGKNKTCTPGCFVKGACQNRWISGDASKWMHGENCFDREHLELAMATHEQTTKYSTLDWCHVPPENTGCQHNELVLDAKTWLDNLPQTVEAVFYNVLASASEQEWAKHVHAAFLRAYRLNEEDVPLLRLDLKRNLNADAVFDYVEPPSPPAPPPPPTHPAGAAYCSASTWCATYASWVDKPTASDSKFLNLWGRTGWYLRGAGDPGCWNDFGGAKFFAEALAGKWCDRNWYEGAWGKGAARPCCGKPAPALLGFDESIWQFCSRAVNKPAAGFSQTEMAARCVMSNNNILRLMGGAWKWNMCQNFAWQLCAATGRLPGQDGAKLHFVTAPKAMRIEEWRRPTSWPCDNGEPCPPGKYAVGDVYFAELAVYRYICSNADELFKVGEGELIRCEVDERAYHDFAERMMRS